MFTIQNPEMHSVPQSLNDQRKSNLEKHKWLILLVTSLESTSLWYIDWWQQYNDTGSDHGPGHSKWHIVFYCIVTIVPIVRDNNGTCVTQVDTQPLLCK